MYGQYHHCLSNTCNQRDIDDDLSTFFLVESGNLFVENISLKNQISWEIRMEFKQVFKLFATYFFQGMFSTNSKFSPLYQFVQNCSHISIRQDPVSILAIYYLSCENMPLSSHKPYWYMTFDLWLLRVAKWIHSDHSTSILGRYKEIWEYISIL